MNPAIDFPVSAPGRLPAWAVGLSLAVHLALLAGPFLQRPTAVVDLPPLAVSFRLPAALAPAVAERPHAPPPPEAASERSRPLHSPAPSPTPAVLALARPGSDSAPAAVAAKTSGVEPGEAAPLPARIAESAQAAEDPDAAAMARYVRLLGDLLARQQQYPRLAAARGWEGEVRLRLQVARKGTIIAVHIVHSSGFEVLDQHAVQLVQNAALPPPPANGGSTDFLIDIPIHYALKRS